MKPSTNRPSDLSGTDSPALHQVTSKSTSVLASNQSVSSIDTDSDSDLSDRPPVDLFVEGKLSDPDMAYTDPDQTLSYQTYRETMRGIRSYMGWTHTPDMDTHTSTGVITHLQDLKLNQPVRCRFLCPLTNGSAKMAKLNITLLEGYPSRSSEVGGLLKGQFVVQPSLNPSATACFLTIRRQVLALGILFPPGVPKPLNSTALTAE